MSAPVPDLKRTVPPPVPGSECCDCCDGIEAETPRSIANPVGLPAIGYRVGDHAHFRASLHAALSSSEFAPLSRLLTRDDGDFTIGLIDAFACSADLLSFYAERIANESYLRTALDRVSLQEMGKLVGYGLQPGLAAETWLAFALETPPAPPPNLPPEPGNFVTGVPASLRLDGGLKVQSVPGPDEKPQTFELVETLDEAQPQWNAIRPWLSDLHFPAAGDTEIWLAGVETQLKPGDGLLFVAKEFLDGASPANWDFQIAAAVVPDGENGRTRIALPRALGAAPSQFNPASESFVFAMRRRAGIFGNNAPDWLAMTMEFRIAYAGAAGAGASNWPNFKISESSGAADLESLQGAITADVPAELTKRSFAILAKDDFKTIGLFSVTTVSEISRGAFAIAAKVTKLALAGSGLAAFENAVRQTTVYARSELLTLAERPVIAAVSGDQIPVAVGKAGLLTGRRLIVRGTPQGGIKEVAVQATLVTAQAAGAGRATLKITPPLKKPLRRETVIVHANVAPASHGESVSQILGSGAAGQSFQRFELKQLPLTYRAAGGESGAAAELVIWVGDVAWDERPTLFGASPTDHVYVLKVDEQGRTFVAFGDGLRGARLPSGTNNVVARYRKGLGAAGNVAADTLTQLMTRPLGLKSVSNLLDAQGGTDPESADAARDTIPLTTRTLGRAVSLLDYEDFAVAFAGIAKAQAQVLNVGGGGATIAITLAAPAGEDLTPASPVWTSLLAALKANGDPHVSVTLLPYDKGLFQIGIRVKPAEDYDGETVLAAVEAALRSAFSFDARALGQPVQQSEVIAVAQAVPGVVAVDLTKLFGGAQPGQSSSVLHKRLLATRMHVAGGKAKAAELLTLDPGPLALLEEMP